MPCWVGLGQRTLRPLMCARIVLAAVAARVVAGRVVGSLDGTPFPRGDAPFAWDPLVTGRMPAMSLDSASLPPDRGWRAFPRSSAVQAVLPDAIPALVPGDLITDLQLAGLIGDPLFELNWKNSSLWAGMPWTYELDFEQPGRWAAGGHDPQDVLLVLEGIKMGAAVYLNGVLVGNATDQFVRYQFAVGGLLLRPGRTNRLTVEFGGVPTPAGRFMACTGGWDWGPYSNTFTPEGDHTFSFGIWKPIYLVAVSPNDEGGHRRPQALAATAGAGAGAGAASSASAPAAVFTSIVPEVFYEGPTPTAPLTPGAHAPFTVRVTCGLWVASTGQGNGLPGSFPMHITGSWGSSATVTAAATANARGGAAGPSPVVRGFTVNVTANLSATAGQIQLWRMARPHCGGTSGDSGLVVNRRSSRGGGSGGGGGIYDVRCAVGASAGHHAGLSVEATVGFRTVSLVTGNDTDAAWAAKARGGDGSAAAGMVFRVNGQAVYARGANVIPMDNMEGRYSLHAHVQMVRSAAAANMNMLRVWGGGVFLPEAFYAACDALGIILYHDMMYTTTSKNHEPTGTAEEWTEISQNVARLAHHPSIVLWSGCNECSGGGLYSSFVLPAVTSVDASRPVWPASYSAGWATGVNTLSGLPNGRPLSNAQAAAANTTLGPAAGLAASSSSATGTSSHMIEEHGPYAHGNGWPAVNQCPVKASGAPELQLLDATVPTAVPEAMPTVVGAVHTVDGATPAFGVGQLNYFASEFGCSVMSSFESLSVTLKPQHWGLHGGGPADNCSAPDPTNSFWRDCRGATSGSDLVGSNPMAERNYPCDPIIYTYFGKPAALASSAAAAGGGGGGGGGLPTSTVDGRDLEGVGRAAFQAQLYLCMLGQALHMKGDIEARRATNTFGTLTWQLNEIWPTGGWGSLEYSAPRGSGGGSGGRASGSGSRNKGGGATFPTGNGQVIGGRWRPLHHLMAQSTFADVLATCGTEGRCYVRNDGPTPFRGTVAVEVVPLRRQQTRQARQARQAQTDWQAGGTDEPDEPDMTDTGHPEAAAVTSIDVDMAAGPGVVQGFTLPMWKGISDGKHVLILRVMTRRSATPRTTLVAPAGKGHRTNLGGATIVTEHIVLPVLPKDLKALPRAEVHASVGSPGGGTASTGSSCAPIPVHLKASDAPALYVTLTTIAQGRFSVNSILLRPLERRTVLFLPFTGHHVTEIADAAGGSVAAAAASAAVGAHDPKSSSPSCQDYAAVLRATLRVEHLAQYLPHVNVDE